jgi:hypothetical protein
VVTGFRKRSCSDIKLERDDDSKKSRHALASDPVGDHGVPLLDERNHGDDQDDGADAGERIADERRQRVRGFVGRLLAGTFPALWESRPATERSSFAVRPAWGMIAATSKPAWVFPSSENKIGKLDGGLARPACSDLLFIELSLSGSAIENGVA